MTTQHATHLYHQLSYKITIAPSPTPHSPLFASHLKTQLDSQFITQNGSPTR